MLQKRPENPIWQVTGTAASLKGPCKREPYPDRLLQDPEE